MLSTGEVAESLRQAAGRDTTMNMLAWAQGGYGEYTLSDVLLIAAEMLGAPVILPAKEHPEFEMPDPREDGS